MKRLAFFVLAITALCYGCAPKSAKLQRSVEPPDKTLFETGTQYLKGGQYIKARLVFQNLINTYPDSDMAPEAVFSMADSYYEEGGTENLLQAEDEYNNFIIFYPASPKAPDAQMKIIALNERMIRSPDRDQQYSHKTLQAIERFERQFPDSDFIPIVRRLKTRVEEVLAQQDLLVGNFYKVRKNYAGALNRYSEVAAKYKDFSAMDEIYMFIADSLIKTNNPDEAAIYLEMVAKGFPFSNSFEDAKAQLKSLGKAVPSVDTELAALNQAKLKPSEGFTPWKPLADFAKAIGFIGPPDQYELAKKTLAAERAKTAEAEALVAAKTGEGSKEGDYQIQTVITQDASGVKTAKTTLGSGSKSAPKSGEEEKKTTPRYKRKVTPKPDETR